MKKKIKFLSLILISAFGFLAVSPTTSFAAENLTGSFLSLVPKTGDNSNPFILIVILIVVAVLAAILGFLIYKRKNTTSKSASPKSRTSSSKTPRRFK